MLAGTWARRAFHGVLWQDANAGKILGETATELVINVEQAQLIPVDLLAGQ